MSRKGSKEPTFQGLGGTKSNQRSGEVFSASLKNVPKESASADPFLSAEAQKKNHGAAKKLLKNDSKKNADAKIVKTPPKTSPPGKKKKIVKVKKAKIDADSAPPAPLHVVESTDSNSVLLNPKNSALSVPSTGSDSGGPLKQKAIIRRKVSKKERNALRSLGTHAKDEADGLSEYFVDRDHKICSSVAFIVFLCVLRFGLVVAATIFTAFFRLNTLSVILRALNDATIYPVLLTTLNGVSRGVYIVGAILILGDLFIIASAVIRRMRAMAFSLVALHVTSFIGMCLSIFILTIGYHRVEIASSLIGNVGFNRTHDAKFLETMGSIQQGLRCCGFAQGTPDWIQPVMVEWNEPLSEEWRQVANSYSWQADCDKGYVCVAPMTCCAKVAEQCNEASISEKEYDEIKMQDFGALQQYLKPKNEQAIFAQGCIKTFAEAIDYWTFCVKMIAVFLLVLWVLLTLLIVLTVAEVDGLGKLQVKHKKINPHANKDLVPLTHRLDRALPFMKKWTVNGAHGKVRLGDELKRARRRKKSSSSSSVSFQLPKISPSLLDSCSSAVSVVKK